jgi:hypothetical protein
LTSKENHYKIIVGRIWIKKKGRMIMYTDFKIKPPFFEVGPKAFLYGEGMLKLA